MYNNFININLIKLNYTKKYIIKKKFLNLFYNGKNKLNIYELTMYNDKKKYIYNVKNFILIKQQITIFTTYDFLKSLNKNNKKKILYIYKNIKNKTTNINIFFISFKNDLKKINKNNNFPKFDLILLEILTKKNAINQFWIEILLTSLKTF